MLNANDNRVKWQIDCDNTIKEKNNVILSSPTGTGKTKRYELWALSKPERPIFITSPIKALSNQKFREFQAMGYKVGLETGDIRYIPYDDCDIICCTQEIYNNKYRNYRNSTLVIDEFSYIFDAPERARAYIDSLQYSEAKNIMICSATFGNPEELKEYINKLTNRDFFLYENKERLTTLEYCGEISKENIKDSLVVAYSKKNCQTIAKEIYQNRVDKILNIMNKPTFSTYDPRVRNKKEILALAKKYNIDNQELIELSNLGVTYYYGSLYPKEKLFIEELFEKRLIDTVVGTDALALGVNFPIKNVIFTQLAKTSTYGIEKISKNLFEQLSGRAGRKGFFDKGYVYYCTDLSSSLDDYSKIGTHNVKEFFYELANSKNENITISLDANIKDILLGKTTIEEEAWFITKYSTTNKNYEEELKKINEIIDYIKSFDITSYYLKAIYNLDIKEGFYKAIEHLTPKTQRRIEKLSESLLKLQPYFEKDIGTVYLNEYSPKQNCQIFTEILMETPIQKLIKRYGNSLYDLLVLRKYMYNLPEKYSKPYDLSIIDNKINSMDYSVLHPNEYTVITPVNIVKKVPPSTKKSKNKQIYNCPHYLDKILINGKEYIKLSVENNKILICEYRKTGPLKLRYIPLNTMYIISGVIKTKNISDLLDRLDFNTLLYIQEESIEKIEGMKLSLKKKSK